MHRRILASSGWAVAVAALPPTLALVALWGATLGGGTLVWGTPLLQFVPWRALAVDLYRDGIVPFWNPLVGAGAPLAANTQSAVFYPLNAGYFWLTPWDATAWGAAFHLALTGWFTYAYLRSLGLGAPAALAGALAFEASGPVATRAHFSSMVSATPWLPVALIGVELALRVAPRPADRRGCARAVALLALGLAMPLLAGHAQLTWMYGLIVVAYGCFRLVAVRRPAAASLRTIGCAIVAVALTAGLVAVQVVPSVELMRLSVRAGGPDFDFAMAYSLPPVHLVGFVLPDFFGNPVTGVYRGYGTYYEFAGYVGLATLGLFAYGLLRWRRVAVAGLVPFWAVTAGVTLVFSLGIFTPVYPWLFEHAPGFDLFQAPARWLYLTAFALATVAAIGLDYWLRGLPGERRARAWRPEPIVIALGVAVALATAPVGLGLIPSPVHGDVLAGLLRLGGLLVLFGVAFALVRRRPAGTPVLLAVVVLDLGLFAAATNPADRAEVYAGAVSWRDAQPLRRFTSDAAYTADFFELFQLGAYRPPAGGWQVVRLRATPNAGMLDGVREVDNYDPPELRSVRDLRVVTQAAGLPDRLLRAFAAAEVRRTPATVVDSVPEPLPRAHLVAAVLAADSDRPEQVPKQMLDERFDPRRNAIVAPADLHLVGHLVGQPAAELGEAGAGETWLEDVSPLRVDVLVRAEQPALLVLADAWYPGWQATVDGRPAPIVRANHAFRGVPVPPGEHEVQFAYQPWWWPWAGLVSLGALGLTLAAFLIGVPAIWIQRRTALPE